LTPDRGLLSPEPVERSKGRFPSDDRIAGRVLAKNGV
jgi:hypothetical protein